MHINKHTHMHTDEDTHACMQAHTHAWSNQINSGLLVLLKITVAQSTLQSKHELIN